MTTILYIFAFIGAWYCLAVATLLALVGAQEWRRDRLRRELRALRAAEGRGGLDDTD